MRAFACVLLAPRPAEDVGGGVLIPPSTPPTTKKASITSFGAIDPLAACLFAPTQVWVTVAAKLNYDIVQLNKGFKAE